MLCKLCMCKYIYMYQCTYVCTYIPFFTSLLLMPHSVIALYIHHNNTDIPHVYIPSTKIETFVIL